MANATKTKKTQGAKKSSTSTKSTNIKKSANASKAVPKKTAVKTKSVPKKKAAPAKSRDTLFRKHTIAEKVAFRKRNQNTILACIAMVFFTLLALFFYFVAVGYDFSGLVCLCIVAIIGFYTFVPKLKYRYPNFTRTVTRIFTVILCIGLLICGITEAIIINASFGNPEESCGYVVVLGAKVRSDGPSLSLTNRIDAAYEYLTAHPEVIAVVSGGQGTDEPITEAQCMYDGLVARGIDPGRIWMEDKATSTWENLNFSLDLIETKTGSRPGKIAVLSSEYHLFRASLFTKECGAEFIGIPAKTTKISLRINYFMREVAGVWHYLLLGGQYNA